MNKNGIKVIIGILFLFIVAWFITNYYSRGEKMFLKRIEDKTLRLESFEITNQQRKVECSNKEVCSYLSNILIMQDRESLGNCTSISYQIKIVFNDNEIFICPMYIGSEGFSLSVSKYDIYEEELPTHCYNLANAPPALNAIFNFLDLSIKDGRGKVLIVNDSGSKIIFDKSLLMP